MQALLSKYEQQAVTFADDCGLIMAAQYTGHFPRFSKYVTAVYWITLQRPGRKPYSFQFSTSINDSWEYKSEGQWKKHAGLPPKLDIDKFFSSLPVPANFPFTYHWVTQTKKSPSLYDILACLTTYDPGSFSDFCSEYGYDEDSKKAEDLYRAVLAEWRAVEPLFSDVIDQLREIS